MNLLDVMSKKVIYGDVSNSVASIASLMKDYDIGFVPILDGNKVVGVITDRDIAIKVVSNGDFDCDISNYMSRDIVSVSYSSSISEVLSVMASNRVKRVLVTDNSKVVGIVSISDFLHCDCDILDTIRKIWMIDSCTDKYESEIDEFYL